jgi:hypothetical protein
MAHFFALKAPTEVVERRWTVPVDDDDGAESVVLSASGVTVDANSFEGNELVLTLSGGTTATTGSITATVTTSQGRVLVETLYIPVIVSTSSAATVEDVISFALRKIYGIGETPPAGAAEHARECLADMLELWRQTGADVGATRPITTSTVIYAPDSYLSAIKNNLIVQASEVFDRPITPTVAMNAARGLQHIKTLNLPDLREGADYF